MTKRLNKALALCLAAAVIGGFGLVSAKALGGDNCKARCEVRYKECARKCGGDVNCMARCRQAKSNCISGCN